jgi:hypothetical protein
VVKCGVWCSKARGRRGSRNEASSRQTRFYYSREEDKPSSEDREGRVTKHGVADWLAVEGRENWAREGSSAECRMQSARSNSRRSEIRIGREQEVVEGQDWTGVRGKGRGAAVFGGEMQVCKCE